MRKAGLRRGSPVGNEVDSLPKAGDGHSYRCKYLRATPLAGRPERRGECWAVHGAERHKMSCYLVVLGGDRSLGSVREEPGTACDEMGDPRPKQGEKSLPPVFPQQDGARGTA
ncbi:hypothetical protein KIL84_012788 [Mauremys mutica]|uniref:Uncharacterized protein n=1 Tax=Mauremys mutica TaxID=74926 RepID=A0A9D3XS69_9SAUR|nr:hypothetical protein KIL84_012788 [Mauremys mutica]